MILLVPTRSYWDSGVCIPISQQLIRNGFSYKSVLPHGFNASKNN